MTYNQMRRTLATALKDLAPAQHKLMKESGELEQYLDSVAGAAEVTIMEARQEILNQPMPEHHLERINHLESKFREVEEIALQNAIEQIRSL